MSYNCRGLGEINDPVRLLTISLITGEKTLSEGVFDREALEKWIVRCKRECSEEIITWEIAEL